MPTIRITASGYPDRLPAVVDAATSDPIPGVRAARINLAAGHLPEVLLDVALAEVDVTTDRVEWQGLEMVPTEALRAELVRRGERTGAQA